MGAQRHAAVLGHLEVSFTEEREAFTFKLQLCMSMQHRKACYMKLTKMFYCLIIKFWLLSLQRILRSWLTKKPPKWAARFDSTVELQLIYNCLYLAHLQSKLSSAPRLSPLRINFPFLLERTCMCRSLYSLSYLKYKNSTETQLSKATNA